MLRLFLSLLFGGVIFAAAVAGSWFMRTEAIPTDDSGEPTAATEQESATSHQTTAASDSQPTQLPIAARPRPMSAEEVFRYSTTLKAREERLQAQEEDLQKEKARLKLVFDDIQAEQSDLESLQEAVQADIVRAEEVLKQVQAERLAMQNEQAAAQQQLDQMATRASEFKQNEKTNLKKASEWYSGMTPEVAAETFRELVNDGKTETAVELLSHQEDRNAAKILEALGDPKLIALFTEEFKKYPNKVSGPK